MQRRGEASFTDGRNCGGNDGARTASGPQITQIAQIQQGEKNLIRAWLPLLSAGIPPDFLMLFRLPNR
jgi:hypothetical protein